MSEDTEAKFPDEDEPGDPMQEEEISGEVESEMLLEDPLEERETVAEGKPGSTMRWGERMFGVMCVL